MTAARATIVIPSAGDRGPVLPYSVASALQQTVADIQIFIIGDGLDAASEQIAYRLESEHERVRFFPFTKGERRGETNRHRVITEHADSEIITYLCDRDLYLPHHVETMLDLLAEADLAHTLRFRLDRDFNIQPGKFPVLASSGPGTGERALIPLTFAGHRLDSYRALPEGWRTTPDDWGTDTYMWQQFLEQPEIRVSASARPTALTFKRGPYPGWPTEERRRILESWAPHTTGQGFEQRLTEDILAAHVQQAATLGTQGRTSRSRRNQAFRRLRVQSRLRYDKLQARLADVRPRRS